MKIGLCQLPVTAELAENHRAMRGMVHAAARAGCVFVMLPEMWCCPYANEAFRRFAEPAGGETWRALRDTAKEAGVWLVGGSVPERDGTRIYNTCYVFSPDGEQIARHRKVHLFDIDVPGGQRFKESDTFTPGQDCTVFDTPYGRMGAAICFDIRFAEWFRIRALDNQCFVAGCSPARDTEASYVAYGHSMVCDPWGAVAAELEEQPGLLVTDIDLERAEAIRGQIPILKGRRTDLYQLRYEK